jgi:hypothetical protein
MTGVTPEEQQIVTSAVLVSTLVVFGSMGMIRTAVRRYFVRMNPKAREER